MARTIINTYDHPKREWKAAMKALVMAFGAGIVAAAAVAMWGNPLTWVPILAAGVVGILTQA
jgi:hypothetical protein